jgi:hypothetical protein
MSLSEATSRAPRHACARRPRPGQLIRMAPSQAGNDTGPAWPLKLPPGPGLAPQRAAAASVARALACGQSQISSAGTMAGADSNRNSPARAMPTGSLESTPDFQIRESGRESDSRIPIPANPESGAGSRNGSFGPCIMGRQGP